MQSICSTGAQVEYPIEDFPIKVVGIAHDDFATSVTEIIVLHAPEFVSEGLSIRTSSKGNYLSLTASIRATSRAQLENLYGALNALPMVKMVL